MAVELAVLGSGVGMRVRREDADVGVEFNQDGSRQPALPVNRSRLPADRNFRY